jgi:hypothetical protein
MSLAKSANSLHNQRLEGKEQGMYGNGEVTIPNPA